jgi:N-glycosylase/DNA lyase
MRQQYIITDLISYLLWTIDRDPSAMPTFSKLSNHEEIWRSLLFCILSSQVRASAAEKAVTSIFRDVPFFKDSISSSEVYEQTKKILSRRDVAHRFPEDRSRQIAHSWFAFAQVKEELYAFLDTFNSEMAAREGVTRLFPGLGLKQASMFLRDIGYSDRLCIIDTHILWYCTCMGHGGRGALTPKRYFELEDFILRKSDDFRVCPNVFDTAVWVAVKTFKANQCMTQFA